MRPYELLVNIRALADATPDDKLGQLAKELAGYTVSLRNAVREIADEIEINQENSRDPNLTAEVAMDQLRTLVNR